VQTRAIPKAARAERPHLRADGDGVAVLTLNRPQQYNALSSALLAALHAEVDAIARDPSVRVVVIAGSGKAFCAGHDLREVRRHSEPRDVARLFRTCSDLMLKIVRLPQPVIAEVNGLATAAGCQLVAQCDLAIGSERASFAVSGINLGLFCSTPAVALSRATSRKRAAEMLFTGEVIDARKALEWGLLNRVVPAANLRRATMRLAATLCAKPREILALGKALFYRQLESGLEAAYADASETMTRNARLPAAVHGIEAFAWCAAAALKKARRHHVAGPRSIRHSSARDL
jgi:enoyl-CoA hydratase/carnithine racemase